jgi:O-antigen/teichoic acid export membrane protein
MNAPWLRLLPAFLRQRLESRFNFQAVVANTGWLMTDKLLRIVVGLLVGAWVARYLGPEQYGELAYALAFIAFFQVVANLGLDGLVVRDIAQDRAKAAVILGTTFRLRLAATFLGWVAACGLMVVVRPGDTTALLLVALIGAGMLFQPADTIDLWFQSQIQSRRTVVAKATAHLLANGAKVGLILVDAPLWTFAVAQSIETALAAILLALAYRHFRADHNWRWNWPVARELLLRSWPLMLSGLSIIIYMRIDQIMLREMVGEKELGIYSAALPFSQVWHFLPMTICASVLPTLSRLHAENTEQFYRRLQQLFSFLAWLAIAIVIGMVLIADWIVAGLLGSAYQESAAVLMVHVTTNVFIFLGVAQGQWILSENKTRVAFIQTALGAAVNIAVNLILIPRWGALGAAIAAVAGQALSAVLSNLLLAPRIFCMQLKSFALIGLRS